MPFLDIGKLGKEHLLRLAVFRKMCADKALIPHHLHGFMRLLEVAFKIFEIRIRDLAFAVEICIVKGKAGLQFKTHGKTLLLHSNRTYEKNIVTYYLLLVFAAHTVDSCYFFQLTKHKKQ